MSNAGAEAGRQAERGADAVGNAINEHSKYMIRKGHDGMRRSSNSFVRGFYGYTAVTGEMVGMLLPTSGDEVMLEAATLGGGKLDELSSVADEGLSVARKGIGRKSSDDWMSGGDEADDFIANGTGVSHHNSGTAIADDPASLNNLEKSKNAPDEFDVIVHGHKETYDGQAYFKTGGRPTHPKQIADAVRRNPAYNDGQEVRLITCGGACGPAQALADELGAPVRAVKGRTQLGRDGMRKEELSYDPIEIFFYPATSK